MINCNHDFLMERHYYTLKSRLQTKDVDDTSLSMWQNHLSQSQKNDLAILIDIEFGDFIGVAFFT